MAGARTTAAFENPADSLAGPASRNASQDSLLFERGDWTLFRSLATALGAADYGA
jgi:hypothetical protein